MILTASLFNGGLAVNSTCADCGTAMIVTDADQTVHPTCQPKTHALKGISLAWLEAILEGDAEQARGIVEEIDQTEEVINLPLAAARYASWSWPVFPLGRQSKAPAIPKDKGGKGFKDANCDIDRITRYWNRHRDHNIGLATGQRFDVVDVDTKDKDGNTSPEGVRSFLDLLDAKRLPQCHGVLITPSGGLHLYVKPTGKGNLASANRKNDTPEQLARSGFERRTPCVMPPGIDYRGKGGYVVAPPSTIGPTWRGYHWLFPPSPELKKTQEDNSEF